MYQIDYGNPIYVHFIGIGGISMSGLAEILMNEGFRVSGSDMRRSELTDTLTELGAKVSIGHSADHIEDQDLVVYTAAIHPDNPEYREAKRRGIPMLSRAELLGEIMANYTESVNIAGTHGKTTTTSMVTDIMLEAGLSPTVTIGGMLDAIGGNVRIGERNLFIAEACEYTDSFLSFRPTIAAVLNIEADHLDYFSGIDDIRESFREFIMKLPQDERGFLVINGDIEDLGYFVSDLSCPYVTFGSSPGFDYSAEDLSFDDMACASYELLVRGEKRGRMKLSVPGRHNVYNSLAAIAVGERLGIDIGLIGQALRLYRGTARRFDLRGRTAAGTQVIDDYAHHPTEIAATLAAAGLCPHGRLYVVFQPHTYTRTQALMDDFAEVLASSALDKLILTDIYAAREKNTVGVSSEDLLMRVRALGKEAVFISDFHEIAKLCLEELGEGDLLITMGAGNVSEIADELTSEDR